MAKTSKEPRDGDHSPAPEEIKMMGLRLFLAIIMLVGIALAAGLILLLNSLLPAPANPNIKAEWIYKLAQVTILALGVITGAGAAALGYRNQRVKEAQMRLQQEQTRLQQDGKFTERFSQAVQHLGSNDQPSLCIGGIYALERLAKDSRADREQIVEVLCSRYSEMAQALDGDRAPVRPPQNLAMQTINKVLKRLFTERNDLACDLSGLELRGLDLSGCYMSKVVFRGTGLRKTRLWGVHLEGTELGGANLEGADLLDAHLESANLLDAHLENATLRMAHLEGAELSYTRLEGARLFAAHLEGVKLWDAHLEGVNLAGANLEGAKLSGAYLEGANLVNANLQGAKLTRARYGSNILAAAWNEQTIFSNGQKGVPDVAPDREPAPADPIDPPCAPTSV